MMTLTACSPKLDSFPFGKGTGTQIRSHSINLQIRYHSVGCFYLEANGSGILTDPFFTHISASTVLFGKLESDPRQIEPHLPPLDRIKAVTIAHGHYDHVLDLPYLSHRLPEETLVLGSQSVACQMKPCCLPQPILPVNDLMATDQTPGQWIYVPDSSIRILPIRTHHAPHKFGLHFYNKSYRKDAELPPTRATDFQEGQPLAFLYDFLNPDGKGIDYRVFFISSSTGPPDGFFPKAILEEKGVDVALVTVDCTSQQLAGKKSVIDFLQPEAVMINHWENFFRTKDQPPKPIRCDLWEIENELNSQELPYIVPMWDRVYEF